MRRRHGNARSRSQSALDPRPVLGLPEVRTPLLVHISAPSQRDSEAGRHGAGNIMSVRLTEDLWQAQDDEDDDIDDDEESDEDDEDDDDEDEEDEETETWQVAMLKR